MKALLNGHVIAASERTVVVEGNHYFPLDDVNMEYLRASRAKTLCPWKGVASYYTVEVEGSCASNAAWIYRHPSPFARRIKNHVAFYDAVQVVEAG